MKIQRAVPWFQLSVALFSPLANAGPNCKKVLSGYANRTPPPIDFSQSVNSEWVKDIRARERDSRRRIQIALQPFAQQKQALEDVVMSVDQELSSRGMGVNISYWMDSGWTAMRMHGFGHPFELVVPKRVLILLKDDIGAWLLMACHELGHVLGTDRLRRVTGLVVAEGEADYTSGRLLRSFFDSAFALRYMNFRAPESVRKELVQILSDRGMGRRAVKSSEAAALAAYRLFTMTHPGVRISFGHPDPTLVSETLVEYPSLQSRLDTVLAGILGEKRPRSWALERDFEF